MKLLELFNQPSSQEIIAQIHNEFDTACDRLLLEANEIIDNINIGSLTDIEKKAKRLENIGFINSESVIKSKPIKEQKKALEIKRSMLQEEANLLQYYKYTYPFQKFITQEELDRICEKYKLIHAPVDRYKMDVPDKNIKDIETAQPLKGSDEFERHFKLIGENDRNKLFVESMIKHFNTRSNVFSLSQLNSGIGNKHLIRDWGYGGTSNMWGYCLINYVGLEGSYYNLKIEEIDKSGLFICAPEKEFDLTGLKRKSKYGFMKVFETEIKDPIVFQYCRGGIIRILTMWGGEASDELLINPINN